MIGSVTAVTASATQRACTASNRPSRLLAVMAASANFRVSCRASVRPVASFRRNLISAVSANALKIFAPKPDVSDGRHAAARRAIYDGMIPPQRVHLAIEKAEGEAFDLRPGPRQMHSAGIAQLEIMAFADVAGGAQADDRHSGGNGCPDSTGAV